MKSFRLARRCLPGLTPAWLRPARCPGRRWLSTVAGACLAAVLAGWPALLAGGGAAGPSVSGSGMVLTAMQGPQARVINPGPPTGLTATAGNAQVTLSWKAPASDGGAPITSYDVYEGTSQNISGEPVASPAGTSVTVKNLTDGTTY